MKRRRNWLIALASVGGVYLLLTTGLFAAMLQPPDRFGRIMGRVPEPLLILMAVMPFETMWNHARGGDLRVGDPAPDFELEQAGGTGAALSPQAVRLSSFRGRRPVVLVFGSYT